MKFKSKGKLTKWALGSQHLWLLLDYDGTLADFALTPEHIEPGLKLISLLEQLANEEVKALRVDICALSQQPPEA